MNPFPIDAISYGNRLRSAPAAEKILFAAGAVALCVGFRSLAVTAVVVTIVTAVLRLRAGIGLRDFWGFLWLPSGFILTGVVPMAVEFLGPQTPGVLAPSTSDRGTWVSPVAGLRRRWRSLRLRSDRFRARFSLR